MIKTVVLIFWGIISLFFPKRTKSERRVAVLLYHAIRADKSRLAVTPDRFFSQIEYLRQQYEIISIDTVVRWAEKKMALAQNAVALTFDDGYEDVYRVVYPKIKELNIPITIFLTTDLSPTPALGNLPRLTAEQIKEMAANPLVSFQVHGHKHKRLTEIVSDPTELSAELVQCREILSTYGMKAKYLAYAFGYRSPAIEDKVRALGFAAAFGIGEGFVRPGDDLFSLHRIQVDGTMGTVLFRLRLTHALDLNHWFVKYVRSLWKK